MLQLLEYHGLRTEVIKGLGLKATCEPRNQPNHWKTIWKKKRTKRSKDRKRKPKDRKRKKIVFDSTCTARG